MGVLTDEPARELGLRVLSMDRPGINESTLQRDRTLLDWPPLLAEVAEQLGIGTFRVLGISGGAPYAFASGWAWPKRVKLISVVSAAPPLADMEETDGLLRAYRWMLRAHRRWPRLARPAFSLARPFLRRRLPLRMRPLLLKLLPPCDAQVLRDAPAFEACFESARRAWHGSAEGVMIDAEIYARPWGFPLDEVNVPVQLWHGRKDKSFSYRLAEKMAERLPRADLRIVEDAGHYSLPIRHMRKILQALKSPNE